MFFRQCRAVVARRPYAIRLPSREKVDFAGPVSEYLVGIKRRFDHLGEILQQQDLTPTDQRAYGKEYAALSCVLSLVVEREKLIEADADLIKIEIEEKKTSAGIESEMYQLVRMEREELSKSISELEDKIIDSLVPRDEADTRGVVLEVRAGTGGDEASLFASEIFKMYGKFAEFRGWKWEQLSLARSDVGGFKDAQASINGDLVYKFMKYEAGVHRVQRIPSNDVKIQTSAVSVIVLPEAEEIDVVLRPQDLRVDVMKSQGAGGQSVNKTESAVRITHIPTGLVVSMQDERSQIQNRARAMKYLRARVYDFERRKMLAERAELRSLSHGTGDRSDKIRTYNFPQDRVSDHRINLTLSGVERMMEGQLLCDFQDALSAADEVERVKQFLSHLQTTKR